MSLSVGWHCYTTHSTQRTLHNDPQGPLTDGLDTGHSSDGRLRHWSDSVVLCGDGETGRRGQEETAGDV